ncbi:hypothetical protein ES703_69083 [subsurface metagenome]
MILFPPLSNGTFELTQHPDFPCLWTYSGDRWKVNFTIHDPFWIEGGSFLWASITEPLFVFGFSKNYKDDCMWDFPNGKRDWANNHYYGGAGWVFYKII